MSMPHHPTDATLAAFAGGTLDEGRSLVVAAHVARCARCGNAVSAFEHIGGALLDRLEPTAMRSDALARAMAAIGGRPEPATHQAREQSASEMPPPLSEYPLGPWRWIGHGVQWRPVPVADDAGTRVFMLKAAPGTRLPHHRHTGAEWTCVFEGAFRHDGGRFGAGDFDEADESVEHRPTVEEGVPCICLVALQGSIEFQGWFGRLLQPFVRI